MDPSRTSHYSHTYLRNVFLQCPILLFHFLLNLVCFRTFTEQFCISLLERLIAWISSSRILPYIQFDDVELPLKALSLFDWGFVLLPQSLTTAIISFPKQACRLVYYLCQRTQLHIPSCVAPCLPRGLHLAPLRFFVSRFESSWRTQLLMRFLVLVLKLHTPSPPRASLSANSLYDWVWLCAEACSPRHELSVNAHPGLLSINCFWKPFFAFYLDFGNN